MSDSGRLTRILLDSSVLLLLYVGLFERERIPSFKNTSKFTIDDFDLLRAEINRFTDVVTTPHVLTEVSNLSGQLGEPARSEYFAFFASQIPLLTDLTVASSLVAANDVFSRLGVTDIAISLIAKEHSLTVLTADFPLWDHLVTAGVDAVNFNHLRSSRLIPEN